ncbi:MAG: ABC transporter ATP-binding protein [Acidobacteria bacterium]|nr:ABC transporter ATP-binding protein [Acidobacteriota bacterium]
MADDDVLIRLENVSKVYTTTQIATHALGQIHLTVRPGELVCIMGPSGSGKSSLLFVLGLLERPTQGRYLLAGRDTSGLGARALAQLRNRYLGFVFQTFNLIPELTVEENVELPLVYRGVKARERRQRVEEVLHQVDLLHRARHYPGQLSGGQQQRSAVARALVTRPQLILADEPTGNLDSASGAAVIELLERLHREGTTVILVTHNPEYAGVADRVLHIYDGHIVDEIRQVA